MSSNNREQSENLQAGIAPCLYSFRRCPYAIRARLALNASKIRVEIREVKLKSKPEELLALSKKATVPVMRLPDGKVIDESLDIMIWALSRADPFDWMVGYVDSESARLDSLVKRNDEVFKPLLDRYKYADRYPQLSQLEHRRNAEYFLAELNQILQQSDYLSGPHMRFADAAIMPFIRQFAGVDTKWFELCEYSHLRRWLNGILASDLFESTMRKYAFWKAGDAAVYF